MKLEKQPKTAVEYWEAIEYFGGKQCWTDHDLADGRTSDPDGRLPVAYMSESEIQNKLVWEVCKKFGIIHPKDMSKTEFGKMLPKPPKGEIYYWDWYGIMQNVLLRKKFNETICSACPFCRHVPNGSIPCELFRGIGTLYHLSNPTACVIMNERQSLMTQSEFEKKVRRMHGKKALWQFQRKYRKMMEETDSQKLDIQESTKIPA